MTPYISVSDATPWLAAHVAFISAWTNASSDQKAAALEEASDHIDSLALKGQKYDPDTQEREFPRYPDRAAYNSEHYRYGWSLYNTTDYSEVPQEVLDACCLEALEILKQGASGRKELREQGVKSFSIGGKLQETFEDAPVPKLLSRKARDKLRFWLGSLVEAV